MFNYYNAATQEIFIGTNNSLIYLSLKPRFFSTHIILVQIAAKKGKD